MSDLSDRYESLKKREVELTSRLNTLEDLMAKQKEEVKNGLKEAGLKKVSEIDTRINKLEKELSTAIQKGEALFPDGIKAEEDDFEELEL